MWPPAALLTQRALAAAMAPRGGAAPATSRPFLAALAESEAAREIAGLALAVAWLALAVAPQVCAPATKAASTAAASAPAASRAWRRCSS
jgi:hypothetical protein